MTSEANDLRKTLEQIFQQPVAAIHRQASPYSSSFQIEELQVRFAGGDSTDIILKNVGADGMLADARVAKPEFLYEPRREVEVYRNILSGIDVGTAKYYGARVDAQSGRHWLFLEKASGRVLRECEDFELWLEATRWLAGFHASIQPDRARALAPEMFLQDEAYHWRWLHRAHEAVGERLDPIAEKYQLLVDVLTSAPRAFIHGEFYASNILIDDTRSPVRICAVDWEMAAVGPALMDVAALASGNWSDEQQLRIMETYAASCAPFMKPDNLRLAFDCCRLQVTLQWLGWSQTWSPPGNHARDWLADALEIADRDTMRQLFS